MTTNASHLVSLPFVPEEDLHESTAESLVIAKRELSTLRTALVEARRERNDAEDCIKRLRISNSVAEQTLEDTQAALAQTSARLEVVTAERDSLRALANAAMTLRETADAELAECRKLAQQALHGPHELRLGVANVLVARLVRGGGQ